MRELAIIIPATPFIAYSPSVKVNVMEIVAQFSQIAPPQLSKLRHGLIHHFMLDATL